MSVMNGALADAPATTPVSSTDAVPGSVVVMKLMRSQPGMKRQFGSGVGTMGGTGNMGGTGIQPSAPGVMAKIPDPEPLTTTGITSRKNGGGAGRTNCPMVVGAICGGTTGCHEVGRIGVPSARVVPSEFVATVSKR